METPIENITAPSVDVPPTDKNIDLILSDIAAQAESDPTKPIEFSCLSDSAIVTLFDIVKAEVNLRKLFQQNAKTEPRHE